MQDWSATDGRLNMSSQFASKRMFHSRMLFVSFSVSSSSLSLPNIESTNSVPALLLIETPLLPSCFVAPHIGRPASARNAEKSILLGVPAGLALLGGSELGIFKGFLESLQSPRNIFHLRREM
jgi:hypothetical protein